MIGPRVKISSQKTLAKGPSASLTKTDQINALTIESSVLAVQFIANADARLTFTRRGLRLLFRANTSIAYVAI